MTLWFTFAFHFEHYGIKVTRIHCLGHFCFQKEKYSIVVKLYCGQNKITKRGKSFTLMSSFRKKVVVLLLLYLDVIYFKPLFNVFSIFDKATAYRSFNCSFCFLLLHLLLLDHVPKFLLSYPKYRRRILRRTDFRMVGKDHVYPKELKIV